MIGFPEQAGAHLYNSAAVCARRRRSLGVYRKQLLPNYSVFDEKRYFEASTEPGPVFEIAGVKVGVSICEDAWEPGPILAMVGERRRARRQHQRVAVLRGPAARARGDARRVAPRRPACRSST